MGDRPNQQRLIAIFEECGDTADIGDTGQTVPTDSRILVMPKGHPADTERSTILK